MMGEIYPKMLNKCYCDHLLILTQSGHLCLSLTEKSISLMMLSSFENEIKPVAMGES